MRTLSLEHVHTSSEACARFPGEELHNFSEIMQLRAHFASHDFSEIVQLRAHFQCSPTGGAQFLVAVFRFAGAPNQEYFVV